MLSFMNSRCSVARRTSGRFSLVTAWRLRQRCKRVSSDDESAFWDQRSDDVTFADLIERVPTPLQVIGAAPRNYRANTFGLSTELEMVLDRAFAFEHLIVSESI